jgi:hypothetical protein
MNCIYWQDCGIKNGGCCGLDLYGSRPSLAVCNRVCTLRKEGPPRPPKLPSSSSKPTQRRKPLPGTTLKTLLAHLGHRESSTCSCASHSTKMDRHGPRWCLKNLPLIVSWLQKEAHHRNSYLPSLIAYPLVTLAILYSLIARKC